MVERKLGREKRRGNQRGERNVLKRFRSFVGGVISGNGNGITRIRELERELAENDNAEAEENYEDEYGYGKTYLYAPDPLTAELSAQYKMPLMSRPNAWRMRDPDFIDKSKNEPCLSRNYNMRRKTAVSTSYRFVHYDRLFNRPQLTDTQKQQSEAIIKFLISPRWFDFRRYLEISEDTIWSGIEGAYLGYEDVDGAICPTSVKHIDGRRFDLYRDADNKFHYGIKIPQDMRAMKLNPLTGRKYHPLTDGLSPTRAFNQDEKINLQVLIYNAIESARGFGWGEGNPAWVVWRFVAWLWWFIESKTEKHGLPIIGISPHKKMRRKKSGKDNLPGPEIKAYLRDLMNQIKDLQAAGIVITPFPSDITLIDPMHGKLPELIELFQFLLEVLGDLMLGSSSMIMNQKNTYGAHKSQSNLARKYIFYDRLFHEDCVNRLLMPRLYYLNEDLFQQIGIEKFYDLPLIKFVESYSLEEKERLEMILKLEQMGHKVDTDYIEEKAGIELDEFSEQETSQTGAMESTRNLYKNS